MTALGCLKSSTEDIKIRFSIGILLVVSTRQRKAELSPEICSFNRKLNEPLWFFYPPFRPPIGSQCEKNAKRRGGRAMSMSGGGRMKWRKSEIFYSLWQVESVIRFGFSTVSFFFFPSISQQEARTEKWKRKSHFLILSSPRNILDPRSFPSYLAASAENGEKKLKLSVPRDY